MNILGVDPGLNCGWCVILKDGTVQSGVWRLAPQKSRKMDSPGMRWLRLLAYLRELDKTVREITGAGIGLLAYEEVRRHKGTDAAHCYGGIVAHLQSWADGAGVTSYGIPVGQIKTFATGKGNAAKGQMIEAAREKWPGLRIEDDNEADARWIATLAASEYGGTDCG